jgi:hypothetical protein
MTISGPAGFFEDCEGRVKVALASHPSRTGMVMFVSSSVSSTGPRRWSSFCAPAAVPFRAPETSRGSPRDGIPFSSTHYFGVNFYGILKYRLRDQIESSGGSEVDDCCPYVLFASHH